MKTRFGKKPLIVGCIGSAALLRRCAKKIPAACDLVEVRLDLTGLCGDAWLDLCGTIQRQGMPVLLTIRDVREGGEWRGREAERLALYLAGLRKVSAVDVEIGAHALGILAQEAHRRGIAVIGSFHDFHGTPELARLRTIETRGRAMGADVVKIATMIHAPDEMARLFALPALAKGPICALGMGGRGGISRIALPCAGSCLAYGALGKSTAPGQWTCRALANELARWEVRKP